MDDLDNKPRVHDDDNDDDANTSSTLAGQEIDSEKNATPPQQSSKGPSTQDDPFLVHFDDNDPANPRNFNRFRKIYLTFLLGSLAAVGSFGSSVVAPAEGALAQYLGVSFEATILTVSLYVLGFAVGPCIWAPLSEVYGRRWSILPAVVAHALFSIGTATSKNAASVFLTRFFGGVFASAPISNVAAALGDLYEPRNRGIAVSFYTVCVAGGPTLGPIVGSALTVSKHLGWRWTEYIEAIFAGVMVLLALIILPELYAPVLLKWKAQRMRKETGDGRYWHPHEKEKVTLSNVFTKYISRPIRMLLTEPMVACISSYTALVYSIVYLFLVVFPIVFEQHRHWSPVISTLPFLAILLGVIAAMGVNLANQPFYAKAVAQNKGRAVPEARLPPMFIGGVLLVVGMFWFGWTAPPQFSWALPVVASALVGGGCNIIFQQCINFLVDVYGPYAASATAANTFLRSIVSFGLPLAAKPMFDNLGVPVASSLLGGICCLALPMPFLLITYSLRLRKRSTFAPTSED